MIDMAYKMGSLVSTFNESFIKIKGKGHSTIPLTSYDIIYKNQSCVNGLIYDICIF